MMKMTGTKQLPSTSGARPALSHARKDVPAAEAEEVVTAAAVVNTALGVSNTELDNPDAAAEGVATSVEVEPAMTDEDARPRKRQRTAAEVPKRTMPVRATRMASRLQQENP